MFKIKRTDLAVEFAAELSEKGIRMTEELQNGVKATCVTVGKQGERLIGKPAGRYITIHCENDPDKENKASVSLALAHYLNRLLKPVASRETVLVAGLGNEWITPDSLGARTVHKIPATAHLSDTREFGELGLRPVAVLEMGVMGQTGIESSEYLHSISKSLLPAAIILIDSLACSDLSRLAKTIQLTDTGICPGSGVGGNRTAINKYNMETKVIAIGVPTVIDLDSIAESSGEACMVTPRNIDSVVNGYGEIIAMGVNAALNPALSREEAEMLLCR